MRVLMVPATALELHVLQIWLELGGKNRIFFFFYEVVSLLFPYLVWGGESLE